MRDRSAIVGISILVGLVLLVWLVGKLNFVRSGPSKTGTIIHNLRLIDGAKQEWALEHHQTGAVAISKDDLVPYLKRPPHLDGWVKPVAGERYTIKLLTESPEAQLTRDLGHLPEGTRFLLTESNDAIVLPQGGADGRQPLSSDTNRTSAAAASRRSP